MSQKFAVSFDAMGKVSSWGPVIEQNTTAVRIVSQPGEEQECWPRVRVKLFSCEQKAGAFFSGEFYKLATRPRGLYTMEELLASSNG